MTTGKDGSDRLVIESPTYVAKYRDGTGLVCKVSTGCRDEDATRSVLSNLERRSELVKSEVLSKGEATMADHQATSIAGHFAVYLNHLRARDERGRSIDVHALRTSFGTLLSKAGVAPRTAQAATRHSKIDLTMNVYTDPRLLDVSGAVESLPSLPLSGGPQTERIAAKVTGTDDYRSSPLAPTLAPTFGKPCQTMACIGTETEQSALAVMADTKTKNPENDSEIAAFSGYDESSPGRTRTYIRLIRSEVPDPLGYGCIGCPGPDLNRQDRSRSILSRVCLPLSPPGLMK